MALNLKLNFKFDLKKLPKGVKIGIAVAPAVIIAVLVAALVVIPKQKDISRLKTEVDGQNNEIAKSRTMADRLDILKVENEKLKKKLEALKEKLPPNEEKEIRNLLKQISDEAEKAGVDILTWKPEAKQSHPSGIVEEVPFSMTVTGTYHDLGAFFANLTRLNRIVNISDIKLGNPKPTKAGDAMLDISLRASTFTAVKEAGK